MLVFGAQQLGFPAYSIFAGLGIRGLAVALPAQENLSNLLGSLVIMVEKPFRVGHFIRIADVGRKSGRYWFSECHDSHVL